MAMNRKKKIIVICGVVLVLALVIIISVTAGGKDVPEVQTAKVQKRANLASKVTASGEIRPVNFFNLTAEVAGRVDKIYVKEGDVVKKNQPLISVDPTQLQLQTQASEAGLRSAQADASSALSQVSSAENNKNQQKSMLLQAKSDLDRMNADLINAEADYKRQTDMLEAGVGTRSAYDSAKARVEGARASVEGGKARITQIQSSIEDAQVAVARAKSNYDSVQARVKQSEASLSSQRDMFQKTTKYAPADGVVSDIAAKEGQYALASFSSTGLMIVNDMSQVNVEVKVDETDIKDVKLDQPAKIKVDALGEKEIVGKVVQIAASAITRSGQSIAQTTGSQEAKDFIVKIQLELNDDLRAKLRPGMSATATITTQTRENILAIPLAAIVQREEEQPKDQNKDKAAAPAAPTTTAGEKTKPKERQGVFVVKANKVIFTPIETGITGETDIEVLGGLNENDEIVVGPFKQLRTLKANAEIKREANNGQKKPDTTAGK